MNNIQFYLKHLEGFTEITIIDIDYENKMVLVQFFNGDRVEVPSHRVVQLTIHPIIISSDDIKSKK